jgi:hypothetical protein
MYLVARLTSPALMPANTVKTFSISLFAMGSSPVVGLVRT